MMSDAVVENTTFNTALIETGADITVCQLTRLELFANFIGLTSFLNQSHQQPAVRYAFLNNTVNIDFFKKDWVEILLQLTNRKRKKLRAKAMKKSE